MRVRTVSHADEYIRLASRPRTTRQGQVRGSALLAQQAVSTLLHTFILHYLTLVRQVSRTPVASTAWEARSVVSCRERGRPGWTNVPIATGGECTAPPVRSTHSDTHETSVLDARWASHRMGGKVSRFLPEGGTLVLAHTSPRSSGLVPVCALSGTRGSQARVRRHGKPKCAPRCVFPFLYG